MGENRMVCLNVQGFLKYKDEIEVILVDKVTPYLAGFTETHVLQKVEDHELYSGYAYVRGNSESSRTGSVYIKEEIKFEIILIESCDRNWWAITIKIADVNFRDLIILIYHSPGGNDAAFIEYLEESCDRALMSDSVIIMGDFNVDAKVKSYIQDKFRKTMNSAGLN